MKQGLLSLLFVISTVLSAQVTIEGHLQEMDGIGVANQEFQVQVMEDFITYTKRTIVRSKTGEQGQFKVQVPTGLTDYLFIDFGKVERYFFAEAGKSYFFNIKAPVKALQEENGAFAKDVRSAEIKKGEQEINYSIDTLDYLCSKFLQEEVALRRNKKGVDTFSLELNKSFSTVKSAYFQRYLKYKVAELNLFHYRNFRERFAKEYFIGENNIADHFQVMHVFNSYFRGHMKNNILIQDNSPFHLAFKRGHLQQCLRIVYPEGSAELQELVLLKGIYEVHNAGKYSTMQINRILDQLMETSSFVLHQQIARNMKGKINQLKENYPAPALSVKGTPDFSLDSLTGKYIYLCFFQAWDKNFEKEVEIMKILAKKYEQQLAIVCISTDQDLEQFTALKTKLQVDWTFIHYNFQRDILDNFHLETFRIDRYDIASTAKYFLLDQEGTFVFAPAKSPSKGFHRDLKQILGQ